MKKRNLLLSTFKFVNFFCKIFFVFNAIIFFYKIVTRISFLINFDIFCIKTLLNFFESKIFFLTLIIISKITSIVIRRTNVRKIFFKKIVKITRKRNRIKNDIIK